MLDITTFIILAFQIIVLIYFIWLNGTYTIFTLLSLKEIRKYFFTLTYHDIRTILSSIFYRPLSIIVPAYNEESTIVPNLKSLMSLKYPQYEVILVNDGSTDKTLEKLIAEFKLIEMKKPLRLVIKHKLIRKILISLDYPNLTVIDKENGGKTDALNAGINASSYPLFCSIDADSLLEQEGLLRAARLFAEDKKVIATGGIVRVLNGSILEDGMITEVKAPKKAVECFQAVEYTRGFLSGRTAWSLLGNLLIISGAFALFRKDIVQSIGGYRDTVGEDMDLVVRLHKHSREKKLPYRVLFVPDPVCYTQAPSDFRSLLKQRNRWHRGLIDSLLFSKKMFFNPKYGSIGIFGFPYFLFVEALGPLVEFLGYTLFILFFILGLISWEFALLFFVIAILWGMWINIGSVLLDNILYKRYGGLKDILKLCLFGFFEMLGYRQLITLERLVATFGFRRKKWGKPKRHEIELDSRREAV